MKLGALQRDRTDTGTSVLQARNSHLPLRALVCASLLQRVLSYNGVASTGNGRRQGASKRSSAVSLFRILCGVVFLWADTGFAFVYFFFFFFFFA